MKIQILFIVLFFLTNNCFSQSKYEVNADVGVMFFDMIHDKNDTENRYYGSALQSRISINRKFRANEKFNFKLGLGYSNFWFLEPGDALNSRGIGNETERNHHYFYPFLGVEYSITSKWSTDLSLLTYFLLEKNLPLGTAQKSKFQNLDLGIKYNMDKVSIKISSPITIFPMYYTDSYGFNGPNGFTRLDTYVENIGINIGVVFKL